MRFFFRFFVLICSCVFALASYACEFPASVCFTKKAGSFSLIKAGLPASVFVDSTADPAVRRVANSFATDIGRVGGTAAPLIADIQSVKGELVIIGVLGESPVIDQLVASGKIDVKNLSGEWEAFQRIVVERPFPNIAKAVLIVGSDRRGAVFGTYDVSEKMGVSPWYWFADVPVQKQRNVFITNGSRRDSPKVKYRGFFINDEDPAFSSWAIKHLVESMRACMNMYLNYCCA